MNFAASSAGSADWFSRSQSASGVRPRSIGLGGAGLALRAEGREDVLERGHRGGGVDFLLQLGGEEIAFFEGLEDGGAAGVEFRELEHAVADGGDLDFVERAGLFLAVAGNEGDGAALGEQLGGGGRRKARCRFRGRWCRGDASWVDEERR
jgi:hypothetical protein